MYLFTKQIVKIVHSNRVTPLELGDKVRKCYPLKLKVKSMDINCFRFTFYSGNYKCGDGCVSDET